VLAGCHSDANVGSDRRPSQVPKLYGCIYPSIENSKELYQILPTIDLSASEMIRFRLALEADEASLDGEPSKSGGREAD